MYEQFITHNTHHSWHQILSQALQEVDQRYLEKLGQNTDWLPGINKVFNAFSLPLDKVQYILFGESPYPRACSANGYAFWDERVNEIWSETGLSKPVNKATSLRNIIKMLLVANQSLGVDDMSQPEIKKINKANFISELKGLFDNLLDNGFLLLNASLVFELGKVNYHSRYWLPFIASLLTQLSHHKITLILFGKIAQTINNLSGSDAFNKICAEHPYNLSFITNPDVIALFKPMNLLLKC
jgi:uracil-DNA glycosylase